MHVFSKIAQMRKMLVRIEAMAEGRGATLGDAERNRSADYQTEEAEETAFKVNCSLKAQSLS